MSKGPILYNDDDTETELPFKWCICSACEGHGKSSAYLGAYTMDEMADAGPEFQEDYMAGHYDRPCDPCGGLGRVKVADQRVMTKEQRRAWREQRRADSEMDAIEAAERRMGA
jgi:hypothetical protein